MSKVFVNIGLSLDGYMAPEGMRMDDPAYKNWGAKWGALMAWLLRQQYFRENLKFGPGGETGPVNDMVRHTMDRTGANIMGKRMFDQGEVSWPEEAPFHTPVYVLTHEKREPWARPGGTTFYFVNEGPARALEHARQSFMRFNIQQHRQEHGDQSAPYFLASTVRVRVSLAPSSSVTVRLTTYAPLSVGVKP